MQPFVSNIPYMLPELQEINRLPMHGAEVPFADMREALSGNGSSLTFSLDGKWDFRLFSKPDEVPDELFSTKCKIKMESIQVPSNWTLSNRFDKPIYTNVSMPDGFSEPPKVPQANPTGIYRRSFRIPGSWRNRRVIIHIGGAESYLEVYLNGKFIGMGKDTRLPSEFDLTPFVDFHGKNLLACKVIRWSDSSFAEDQDQWWMAGIFRSVYLYSTAYTYFSDFFCNADYDYSRRIGMMRIETHLGFDLEHWTSPDGRGPTADFTVRTTLYDKNRKKIWHMESSVDHRFRRSEYQCNQTGTLKDILPWSSEDPNLYTVTAELLDDNGNLLDIRKKRIGFRHIEIAGRDLLFNGRRVLIRGINRHEHNFRTGKTLTMEDMLADIRLLKQYNFNAVRTSHYPNDARWYDLCDEYGIYVMDEANTECHAYYSRIAHDYRWKECFVKRAERMVLRDRSHACIFCWSLGNESGHGEYHLSAAEAVGRLDNTRPIHHEGELKPWWIQAENEIDGGNCKCNAFIDPMYPTLDFLEQCSRKSTRPVILSEYAHAMGNSSGSICDYWDMFLSLPALQGGFIWDWIDQGILSRTPEGRPMIAYGGDFGEKTHDLNFNCNGMLACDRRLHPAMNEFRHLAQFVKVSHVQGKTFSFEVTNRRNFTSLGDLAGEWLLEISGEEVKRGRLDALGKIGPGASAVISLPLEKYHVMDGEEAFVQFRFTLKKGNAWASAGTLLAHDQINCTDFLKRDSLPIKKKKFFHALEEGKNFFRLQSGDCIINVNRESGEGCITKNKTLILSSIFDSILFRAATDNDGIRNWTGQESKPMGQWLAAGLDHMNIESVKVTGNTSKNSSSVSIEKLLSGKNPKAKVLFRQTITAKDGGFVLRQKWDIPDAFPSLPRVGVIAFATKGFEEVEWFGRGPWENYCDRKRSAEIRKYQNTVTGMYEDTYVVPQENGNRSDVRYFILRSPKALLRISARRRPFEFGVSHFTPDDLFAATHQCELIPRKQTVITVDCAQRGLGTGACGPQTFSPYTLDKKQYSLEFLLEIL